MSSSTKRRSARSEKEVSSSHTSRGSPLSVYIVGAMEFVLLALVCLTPWAYGTVHPSFEFLLDAGIALLLTLWAARMLLERQITWKQSSVAICLAGLFLFAVGQRTPLSPPVLAWLSPSTAHFYDELLPKQPEILPNDKVISDAITPPRSTISLYPGATRKEATRFLTVFLVFVFVFNNLTSKETLIRLSWVALINGVLLSVFALAQFFGGGKYTVYWTYPSMATPFGPFICHNHFPDYVSMCIGLGIGLLLSQSKRGRSSSSEDQEVSPLQILQNPRALWICAALGLMISAVAFSRSRGGLLALVGTAAVCGFLGWLRLGRSLRIGAIAIVIGLVVALSAWFGLDLVKSRLATVFSGEALESRVPLWLRSLPIVADFPIWGTGYGTFGYVEQMYRQDVPSTDEEKTERALFFDHAHNDYLEVLVEGGVVSLGLVLVALAVVYRRGYRALVLHSGHAEAGLTLGALFGFTALALHSLAEFGTHIPAITLIGTVVCAHLCALDSTKPHKSRSSRKRKHRSSHEAPDTAEHEKEAEKPVTEGDEKDAEKKETASEVYSLRLGGLAPLLGAVAAVGFGLMLCSVGWKNYRIDRLEDAAFRAGDEEPDQLRARIACLDEAVTLGPEYARLHDDLGFAHAKLAKMLDTGPLADRPVANEEATLALEEYIRARDACPLFSGAQLGIAAYASQMKSGDSPEEYIRRAKLLTPGQDEMWYLCGLQEFTLKRDEDAFATWRHSLELSKTYLPQILTQTRRLRTDQLIAKVLPDKPDILLNAALSLYPDATSVERKRPFLAKALSLLESKDEELGPQDWLVRARAYRALDEPDAAKEAYRHSIAKKDPKMMVRREFAHYLYEVGPLEEALSIARLLLAQNPSDGDAQQLFEALQSRLLHEDKNQRKRPQDDAARQ